MRSGGDQPIRPGFVPSWVDLATVFGWAPSLPVVQQTWSSPSLQKRRHCHSHCLHRWMVWALQMAETEKACKNITFQKMAESRHQYHQFLDQRLHTHQLQVLKTITCSNSPKTFSSRSGSSRNLPLFLTYQGHILHQGMEQAAALLPCTSWGLSQSLGVTGRIMRECFCWMLFCWILQCFELLVLGISWKWWSS